MCSNLVFHRIKSSHGINLPPQDRKNLIPSNFPYLVKLSPTGQNFLYLIKLPQQDQTFPLGSNFPQGIDCHTLRDNSKIPVWNTGDKLVYIYFMKGQNGQFPLFWENR